MRQLFIICLILAYSVTQAQEYDKLPPKYQNKLNSIKGEKKRLRKYRKYLKKDSIQRLKATQKIKRLAKRQITNGKQELPLLQEIPTDSAAMLSKAKNVLQDSLRQAGIDIPQIDSTYARSKINHEIGKQANEELGFDVSQLRIDSTYTDQAVNKAKQELGELSNEELGVDLPNVQLDSAGRAELIQSIETRAEKELKNVDGFDQLGDKGELGKLEEYKGQLEQTRQQAQQALAKQQMKEKMANQAKKFISQNAEKLQQVQSKMGELKKKYSYVPNSNDLSTAKKRTSLADEPLGKRLVFGGNFNISETNPVAIDISPAVSYRINKLFEIGITGLYRAQFNADRAGVTSDGGSTYGYSAFISHMVFKNFFGYAEGENISRLKTVQDQSQREWDQTLLAGIGRRFSIAKWLEMQAIITYNFLHENRDGVYNSPIVFKTGIRIK